MRTVAYPEKSHHDHVWEVVRRHLAVTPVVAAPQLGRNVSLKVETFQPTGSFKVRGGLAAVAATLESTPGREVVAASAGNHGLGLAYAAAELGARVTVIVPRLASAGSCSSRCRPWGPWSFRWAAAGSWPVSASASPGLTSGWSGSNRRHRPQ